MSRTKQSEVALVERGELGFTEPFNDRQNRRVHEADVGVGVPITYFSNSLVVGSNQLLNVEGTGNNIVQQRRPRTDRQPLPHPVVNLDQHWRRNDQRLRRRFEQTPAGRVVCVASIHTGEQRTGVQDQHHVSAPILGNELFFGRAPGQVSHSRVADAKAARTRPVLRHFFLQRLANELSHGSALLSRRDAQSLEQFFWGDDSGSAQHDESIACKAALCR